MYYTNQEDIPLDQRRGYESSDQNVDYVLVRAPIEQVAQAFCELRQADFWERDAYKREVKMVNEVFILLQLQGHQWTVIRHLYNTYSIFLTESDAQELSRLLNTRAIYYNMSDSCEALGYHLYDCGTCIEMLCYGEGCSDYAEQEEENIVFEDEDVEVQKPFEFQSQIYQFEIDENDDPYALLNYLLEEQDAYVPALFEIERIARFQPATLRLADYVSDDFERIDYVGFDRGVIRGLERLQHEDCSFEAPPLVIKTITTITVNETVTRKHPLNLDLVLTV
jgi:hypothetical protein